MCLLLIFLTSLPLTFGLCYIYVTYQKWKQDKESNGLKRIAFFHPYCNAGGGGERVLWSFIKSLQLFYPNYQFVIYSGDINTNAQSILEKAKNEFQVTFNADVKFVFLNKRKWVEAKTYPFFTLLCQSIGSMILGFEALFKLIPDIFVDTMGYSFTFPIFKYIGRCKVIAYVHYPVISTDMLEMVSSRKEAFNNRSFISNSKFFTNAKLFYYHFFAKLYGLMGRRSDLVFVNSSWTFEHISKIWKMEDLKVHLLYPPCDTNAFLNLPLTCNNNYVILSISQFRPEKNHKLQIASFAAFLKTLNSKQKSLAKLIVVGSCRDKNDENRVIELKKFCEKLHVKNKVEFKLNISFKELLETIKQASIGIHTMKNEHFGIGIVELMAAGLITIAHRSGGPKLDIIKEGVTGFLADLQQEYVDTLVKIVHLSDNDLMKIRSEARKDIEKFSYEKFSSNLVKLIKPFF